jgi:hypothetical protein
MAWNISKAVWKARALDGRKITQPEGHVLARIADEHRVDTGFASISLSELAADCKLTKPGALGILKRLVVHYDCSVHPTDDPILEPGACPRCGTTLELRGCVEIVLLGAGRRPTQYRILTARLSGQRGLPLADHAPPSLAVNPVELEVNGVLASGQPCSPIQGIQDLPRRSTAADAAALAQEGETKDKPRPAVPRDGQAQHEGDAWARVIDRLGLTLKRQARATWFGEAVLIGQVGKVLHVQHDAVCVEFIRRNFQTALDRALALEELALHWVPTAGVRKGAA